MKKKLALIVVFALTACVDPQADLGLQYAEKTQILCGTTNYENATRENVVEIYNCISGMQKRMLIPALPNPDISLNAISQLGVAVDDFAAGKINKPQFLARESEIEMNRVSALRARYSQPTYTQHAPAPVMMQNPQYVPTGKTICRNQGYGEVVCEQSNGVDLGVFGQTCSPMDYQTGRCR